MDLNYLETQTESQQVLNVPSSSYLKSESPEQEMIKSVVSLDEDKRLRTVCRVREALQKIQTSDFKNQSEYQTLMDDVEDCLFAICKAGIAKIAFTPEEKLELGVMVHKALPAIGYRLCYINLNFPPRDLESSNYERSGLQFLFDDYKDFPVSSNGDGTVLSTALSEFRAEEDGEVEDWDEYLQSWFFDYLDPSIGFPQCSPDVPSSHWWFYKERGNSETA